MEIKTRRELVDELYREYEIPEGSPASEFISDLEAPRRERDRNIRTQNESSWYGYTQIKTTVPSLSSSDTKSAMVLLLDLVGVGGHRGMGWTFWSEGSSQRLLSNLGSGRWHANDGQAYRASAITVFVNLTNDRRSSVHFTEEELRFSVEGFADVVLRYKDQNSEVIQRVKTLIRAALYGLWNKRSVVPVTGVDIESNACLIVEISNDFKSLAKAFNSFEGEDHVV